MQRLLSLDGYRRVDSFQASKQSDFESEVEAVQIYDALV